jgi:CrcB protein
MRVPGHNPVRVAKGEALDYVWIGIGGVAGANARYLLGRWIGERAGAAFPYGTLLVNVSGAFVIGVLLTVLTEWLMADPRWRLLLVVGFLGSYTTFSSYTYEVIQLVDRGDWAAAAAYVLSSNAVGLLACGGGVVLARALAGR